MFEHTQSRLSAITQSWFSGTTLSRYADAYVDYLSDRGYASASIDCYLRCVAHFAHWSAPRLRALQGINEELVRCFVDDHLPDCRCAPRCVRAKRQVRAALAHLLALLREKRLIAANPHGLPAPVAAELNAFDNYLAEIRGLQAVTRQSQLKRVQSFLLDHFTETAVQVATLGPGDIEQFTRRYTVGWKPSSVNQVCIALRSYLRFKATQGIDTVCLVAAIPQVAQWRLCRLPRGVSAQEVKRLLDAFDRSTATGRRDYAIARCLVDLGLRSIEVARLTVDDIDWRQGRLLIRSKGRRTDVLPLPLTTGRALVAYLRSGRRKTPCRALFLRHRPPLDEPASTGAIRAAIRNAARRCGLDKRITGTHILRHTLAGQLVQSGASLKEIADLLRHRSLDTTTIYAKVDLDALSTVAAPWPGRQA